MSFLFLKKFFREKDIELGFSKFYSLEGPKKIIYAIAPRRYNQPTAKHCCSRISQNTHIAAPSIHQGQHSCLHFRTAIQTQSVHLHHNFDCSQCYSLYHSQDYPEWTEFHCQCYLDAAEKRILTWTLCVVCC